MDDTGKYIFNNISKADNLTVMDDCNFLREEPITTSNDNDNNAVVIYNNIYRSIWILSILSILLCTYIML